MRKQIVIFYGLFFIVVLTIFSGCMVGPDYSRPETPADTSDGYYNAAAHEQDVNDFSEVDRWWEQFGDSTTAILVRETLENNYSLKASAAGTGCAY
jgi:outer membrane protein TolC